MNILVSEIRLDKKEITMMIELHLKWAAAMAVCVIAVFLLPVVMR